MAATYPLYYVYNMKTRPGKSQEAAKWWREKGKAWWESLPGVKGIKAYATQFGLGGPYTLELWGEIEDYATMDRWDQEFLKNAEKHGPIFKEWNELFESGGARLMGDWPESEPG